MFDSKLEVIRGFDGHPDLRYDLDIDTAEEALFPGGYFPAGLIFNVDSTGVKAKIGGAANKMPYILAQPSDRPMSSLQGAANQPQGGYVGAGSRKCRFYACIGNFEVSTTEYKPSVDYTVDMPLKAAGFATPGTYDSLAGRVQPAAVNGTHTIIGWVTRPTTSASVNKNKHGSPVVQFITDFSLYRAAS